MFVTTKTIYLLFFFFLIQKQTIKKCVTRPMYLKFGIYIHMCLRKVSIYIRITQYTFQDQHVTRQVRY